MSLMIELPSAEEISTLDAAGLEQALVDAERVRRQVEAVLVDVLDVADRERVWADDRHASVRQWALALTNTSNAEMRRRLQTMRAVRDLDGLRAGLRAGDVGVCQARELAGAHANPRARESLPESEAMLVDHARHLRFDRLQIVMRRWVSLADPDGARRSSDEIHQARHAELSQVGDEYHLTATGGTAQGASMDAIFRAFCDAEFERDWRLCRQRFGEAACAGLMERTPAQRRFDALHQVFAERQPRLPPRCASPTRWSTS